MTRVQNGFEAVPSTSGSSEGLPAPKVVSKILHFSSNFSINFKGKNYFQQILGSVPPSGQNSTGPPDQNPGSASAIIQRVTWDKIAFLLHITKPDKNHVPEVEIDWCHSVLIDCLSRLSSFTSHFRLDRSMSGVWSCGFSLSLSTEYDSYTAISTPKPFLTGRRVTWLRRAMNHLNPEPTTIQTNIYQIKIFWIWWILQSCASCFLFLFFPLLSETELTLVVWR